jgi:hypothetical protein
MNSVESTRNTILKEPSLQRQDSVGRQHSAINRHLADSSIIKSNKLVGKMLKPDNLLVKKLLKEEEDDRYRYLLKHGNIHYIENESYSLFVELPQIPNVIIVYRRPQER